MKTGDAALRKAIKTRRDTDMLIYKGFRNKVIEKLSLAKSGFYLNILNEAKGNSKLIWKNIDNLTRRDPKFLDFKLKVQGVLIEDHLAVASVFNNFFLESVCELGKQFTKRKLNIVPIDATGPVFELVETNETQVSKIICSLKSSKCRDVFQLDTMFVKSHKDILTPPTAHLINCLLNTASP